MKYKPIHPKEIDQDWKAYNLSPQSLAFMKQANLDHMAERLGLSPRGKFILALLLDGGQAGMIDGEPVVRAGPNMHSFPVGDSDWNKIKILLK